jgi:ABC-type sugar transport system ATPase subunit
MSFLRLENIVKTFGEHPAVQGVSLEAERGEFVVFVGPSGCGKSTLLRIVAGLEDATEGRSLPGRRARHGSGTSSAPGGHGVPVLRPVPPHDG